MTATQHPTRLGDQVIYHAPKDGSGSYAVAAIVTMTAAEWVDGADIEQPDADCVHLNVLWPPTADGARLPSSEANVPYGTGAGCWTER